MRDGLHLYPTVGALLWLWATGVALQVTWRVIVTQRRKLVHTQHAAQKKSDGDSASTTATSARTPLFYASNTSSSTSSTTEPPTTQPLLWRKVSKQSLVLTLLVAVTHTTASSVLLFARTGAWTEQPYDWYALAATGARRFGATTPLPAQILSTCRFRNVSKAPRGMQTLDDVVAAAAAAGSMATASLPLSSHRNSSSARTVVYVVPYSTDGVLELDEHHVTPVRSAAPPTRLRASILPHEPNTSHDPHNTAAYERTTPLDDLTLFPYVWHSLLGPHFDARVVAPTPWTRTVAAGSALTVEYRLVRSQQALAALPRDSNVLAIVQGLPTVLHLLASNVLRGTPSVGVVALAREDCNNRDAQAYWNTQQLTFGFVPYGDCALVDGARFQVLPLGPSFEHGFPLNTHVTRQPHVNARRHVLNLLVSWTPEKPTRVQAMLAALAVCDQLGDSSACVIEHNDVAFKALQRVDMLTQTNLRWLLSSAPDTYVETLKQSIFTLCPMGKNPEQYRIWEALAAGSIPIIEAFPQQSQVPGTFYHPAYPMTWKCVPEDLHGVLRDLDAPVLFVQDWRTDLPRIIESFVGRGAAGRQALQEQQRRVQQWYVALGRHVQASVVGAAVRHFKTES